MPNLYNLACIISLSGLVALIGSDLFAHGVADNVGHTLALISAPVAIVLVLAGVYQDMGRV